MTLLLRERKESLREYARETMPRESEMNRAVREHFLLCEQRQFVMCAQEKAFLVLAHALSLTQTYLAYPRLLFRHILVYST